MVTGTQRRVNVVLGAITQPPPMPATSSAGAIHQPTTAGGATRTITAVADRPDTTSVRPVTVSRRPQRVDEPAADDRRGRRAERERRDRQPRLQRRVAQPRLQEQREHQPDPAEADEVDRAEQRTGGVAGGVR